MSEWLKKYTNFQYLEKLLKNRQIHMATQEKWPDENDRRLIKIYKDRERLSEVHVACLTMATDRFHFWKIFGKNKEGICLWFHKETLIKNINKNKTLISKEVKYLSLKRLKILNNHQDLPFIKRLQYKDEKEFRVLRKYQSGDKIPTDSNFSFPPNALKRIYLSPYLPVAKGNKRKSEIIKWLDKELQDVDVSHNKTLNYKKWINAAKDAAGQHK